jgi:hypothetical protein
MAGNLAPTHTADDGLQQTGLLAADPNAAGTSSPPASTLGALGSPIAIEPRDSVLTPNGGQVSLATNQTPQASGEQNEGQVSPSTPTRLTSPATTFATPSTGFASPSISHEIVDLTPPGTYQAPASSEALIMRTFQDFLSKHEAQQEARMKAMEDLNEARLQSFMDTFNSICTP